MSQLSTQSQKKISDLQRISVKRKEKVRANKRKNGGKGSAALRDRRRFGGDLGSHGPSRRSKGTAKAFSDGFNCYNNIRDALNSAFF